MEYITWTTQRWHFKKSNGFNQNLTNRHPAASKKYHCQQCESKFSLVDGKDHLGSAKH